MNEFCNRASLERKKTCSGRLKKRNERKGKNSGRLKQRRKNWADRTNGKISPTQPILFNPAQMAAKFVPQKFSS